MVLPLVPLALIGIGVISGASGAALGLKGGHHIKSANEVSGGRGMEIMGRNCARPPIG